MQLLTDIDVKALDSIQLIRLLGDITQEVWKRHDNNGDVMVLKTGAVRIRRCPDCGNAITVFCAEVNIPDDKIAAVKDHWYEFLKKNCLVPPDWMYANVPCKPGKWYTAYCGCWARDRWFDSAEKAADFYMSENHGIDKPVFVNQRSHDG